MNIYIIKSRIIRLFLITALLFTAEVNVNTNVNAGIDSNSKTVLKKFKTERAVNDYLKGYGDIYKDDITSYEYLSGYSSQSEMFKISLNKQWQVMPDKIRDVICYCKIPVRIVKKIKDAPGANGLTKSNFGKKYFESEIELRSNSVGNNALIHECAHSYDDFLYRYLGVKNHRKTAKKLYAENPEMYGFYGSTSFNEFYAEMTCNEILKNIKTIPTGKLANYVIKNYKVFGKTERTDSMRILKLTIPDLIFETDIEPVTINGEDYYNGMKEQDFLNCTGKKIAKIYVKKRHINKEKFDQIKIKVKF